MSKYRFVVIQDPESNDIDAFSTFVTNYCKDRNIKLDEIQFAYLNKHSNNMLTYQFVRTIGTNPLNFDVDLNEKNLDMVFTATKLAVKKKRFEKVHVLICVRPKEKFGIVNCVKKLAQRYNFQHSVITIPFSEKFVHLRPKAVVDTKKKDDKPFKIKKTTVRKTSTTSTKRKSTSTKQNIFHQLFPFVFSGVSKSRSITQFDKKLQIKQDTSTITSYIPTSDEITALPFKITDEQQLFLDYAKQGNNVLIQSCVGGGKTTLLQQFVEYLPPNKNAIFLTFNKYLKIDVLAQITNPKVWVTNYHGFASRLLIDSGMYGVDVNKLLSVAINQCPPIPHYDVIVIDEFQDLDMECAKLVTMIVESNPNAQIIVAGGMEQKNRPVSMLRAQEFIEDILGTYKTVQFSISWRLSPKFSDVLSLLWGETITGMNENMQSYVASVEEAIEILSKENPEDIMVIGNNHGIRTKIQNQLMKRYLSKYNQDTMHVSSSEYDYSLRKQNDRAVFTNYDSCKGMERKTVVITDFTIRYFTKLLNSGMEPDIIRNLLCVAASRASQKLIFVQDPTSEFISMEDFKSLTHSSTSQHCVGRYNISSMLNSVYKESVSEILKHLTIKERNVRDTSKIELASPNCFIDSNRLCGIFQEANFFFGYNIENDYLRYNVSAAEIKFFKKQSLEKKVLLLAEKETGQQRYRDLDSFVDKIAAITLNNRLHSLLNYDTPSQVFAQIDLSDDITCQGYADAVLSDCVYELKYCNYIQPEYYVQCAMYMLALNKENGLLWNTKNNTQIEITINDKEEFKNAVIKAIKKEKANIELVNKKANQLIAIINPTEKQEYTISILNKMDGTTVMAETKCSTMNKNVFDAYSVNKIFVTQNIDNASFVKSLVGYQVYNVSSLIAKLKCSHRNASTSQLVLNIFQDEVDLSKYQYKSTGLQQIETDN